VTPINSVRKLSKKGVRTVLNGSDPCGHSDAGASGDAGSERCRGVGWSGIGTFYHSPRTRAAGLSIHFAIRQLPFQFANAGVGHVASVQIKSSKGWKLFDVLKSGVADFRCAHPQLL
jgi:hypothetical protein